MAATHDTKEVIVVDPDTAQWLTTGDPSVAWQAERDLLDTSRSSWQKTRGRIAAEGWGRSLLDAQDPAGTWGNGLYTPKWTSTHYTLLLLARMGLDPANEAAITGSRHLLDDGRWVHGGVTYWKTHRHPERCVNAMLLGIASWFDVEDDRIDDIAEMLIGSRMTDGGWNCDDYRGGTHSSFHSTISALEGLLAWKRRRGSDAADAALASGQEVLLAHRMFRSHRTGEVIDERWLKPSFPPRWHYDVLRGLDHLRDAGCTPDNRAAEAVEKVAALRRPDGRWGVGPRWTGKTYFVMEAGRGPSRWNTLRAQRVLRWWESSAKL